MFINKTNYKVKVNLDPTDTKTDWVTVPKELEGNKDNLYVNSEGKVKVIPPLPEEDLLFSDKVWNGELEEYIDNPDSLYVSEEDILAFKKSSCTAISIIIMDKLNNWATNHENPKANLFNQHFSLTNLQLASKLDPELEKLFVEYTTLFNRYYAGLLKCLRRIEITKLQINYAQIIKTLEN